MKNKRKTYILLVIVLIIWGLLVYQFFRLRDTAEAEIPAAQQLNIKPMTIVAREPVIIDVKYRDPFLGKMYMPENNPKPKKIKPRVKEPVIWPEVIYKGLISDTKDKKKVFMVIIQGKTFLMREKQTENQITLLKGSRSSIDIKFKGEHYNILIQQ